ncbi:hypothetical protein PG994_012939 [Apiospora phragmitis]|uniref:Clr5 domain-containing protein n=1 Tax=Apiospora phragmitis TaxID=2905665 RepID=A0ABR1T8X4_9PEZI
MEMTNTTDKLAMYRDWEGYRSIITRLYSEENRPLKEVVDWMAQEYEFHATEKMYKDRLKRWGIRKYMKSAYTGEGELSAKRTLTPRHRDLDPHRIRQFLHQSSFRLRKSAPGKRSALLSTARFSPTTLDVRGDLAGIESALRAVTTYTNTCFETGPFSTSSVSGTISPEPLCGTPRRWPASSWASATLSRSSRAKLESVEEPRQLQEAVRTMTGAELDTVDRHVVPGSLYPTRSRVMVALALYCNALADAVSTEARLQAIYTAMWWYRAHGGGADVHNDNNGGWIDWGNHPLSQVAIDDSWTELEEFARQKRIQGRISLMEGDYTAMLQDVAYDDAVNGNAL